MKKNRTLMHAAIHLAILASTSPMLYSGVLLQWNTFGNAGTETSEASVANDVNISAASLTLGSVTAAANANRFGGNNWFDSGDTNPTTLAESVAGNDYIQFTVTPNAGYKYTVDSFAFTWDRSGTGPTAVALRSSADGYAANLGSITGIASLSNQSITITGLTDLTTATTFRLYGYSATATTGTGGFDTSTNAVNVQLNGSTLAIGGSANYLDTNGAAAGLGIDGGGSTVWDTTSSNWADSGTGTGSPKVWDPATATYFGGTPGTVNVSTVAPQAGMQFDSSGYILNGGTITLTTVSAITVANAGETATINSQISGTVGLTKAGAGTLVLGSATSDFTGNVNISAGVLQIASDAALGGSTAVALNAGTTLKTTASISSARGFSGTGTLDIAPSTTFTSTGAFGMTGVTLSNTGTLDLTGATPGVGTLTLTGGGTLTSSNATLIAATNISATSLSGTATVSGTAGIDMGTGGKTIDVGGSGTLVFNAPITLGGTGNNALRKTGAGAMELNTANPNLYRVQIGSASVSTPAAGGTLKISNKAALGNNQLFLNNGTLEATVDLTGSNAITVGISTGGLSNGYGVLAGSNMEFSGSTLLFTTTSQQLYLAVNNTTTLAGTVTQSGSGTGFALSGSGTLVINGDASGVTLPTTVTSATLVINNNYGGDVSLAGGGALKGTGSITGDVATAGGTTLAPGNSIGEISVGSLIHSGVLEMELGAGASDHLIVNGDLTLSAGSLLTLLGTADGVTNYTLVTYTGTLAGAFDSPSVPEGYTLDYGSGSNSAIMLQLVPEPMTLGLLALGAMGMFARRRRG